MVKYGMAMLGCGLVNYRAQKGVTLEVTEQLNK